LILNKISIQSWLDDKTSVLTLTWLCRLSLTKQSYHTYPHKLFRFLLLKSQVIYPCWADAFYSNFILCQMFFSEDLNPIQKTKTPLNKTKLKLPIVKLNLYRSRFPPPENLFQKAVKSRAFYRIYFFSQELIYISTVFLFCPRVGLIINTSQMLKI